MMVSGPMPHFCHAVNCKRQVNKRLFMCSFHWAEVPTFMQVEIKKHFHPDQVKGKRRPSMEYLQAARKAINYVRAREVAK
jgi:hypothetical protein